MNFAMLISITIVLVLAPCVLGKEQSSIYLTTYQRGVTAFSLETNQTKKILNYDDSLLGITYDSTNNKLYFSTFYQMYRANMDGTGVETVLDAEEYGSLYGLTFDEIGGNVYVATSDGYILACGAGAARTFSCYTILQGQGRLHGISLDPTEGLMYWTVASTGSIRRAGMDGSSPTTLVTGLNDPYGVTIDFLSRRLYWTELNGDKIQSSDLDGSGIQRVLQFPFYTWPWGIAVLNDRIYWGNWGDNKLQSCTKDGQDVQTLHAETDDIHHLAIVPPVDRPTTRANDCAGRNCTKLCVLTPSSYRCLD